MNGRFTVTRIAAYVIRHFAWRHRGGAFVISMNSGYGTYFSKLYHYK